MRPTVIYAIPGIVMLSGLALRTWNVNFDGELNVHPDERGITCRFGPMISFPSSLDELSNPRRSPLNPLRDPQDARRRSFPYGHFPLYLGIVTGELLSVLAEPASLLPLPERTITLMERASRWVNDEAPDGSVILWEDCDDPLPMSIPGEAGMDAESHDLRHIAWATYAEDTEEKYEILRERLREADYVIYSSNRLYGSVDELPERYPMTIRYNEPIFGEQLGFVNVADFTSPPRLLGVSFTDQGADKSWTLYDHPRVSIFAKQWELSTAEFDAVMGNSWEGATPLLLGNAPLLNSTLRVQDPFADFLRSRAQPLHDQLELLTVHYEGDISLHRLALGQGEEQLSSQEILELERDRALWMVLQWQVKTNSTADFAI